MGEKVIDRVMSGCRNAMIAGVPIIYIKTDSRILIRRIVQGGKTGKKPLVTLIGNGDGGELLQDRPIAEWIQGGKVVTDNVIKNYKDSIDQSFRFSAIKYPFIWTHKMSEEGNNEVLKKLENYVIAHEDSDHPAYDILQSSVVILYSSTVRLSSFLQTYTEVIDVGYPDNEEIKGIICQESGNAPGLTDEERLSILCTDLVGFSTEEIVVVMGKIMALSSLDDFDRVREIIRRYKSQKMEGGILEQKSLKDGNIGGMNAFKKWLEDQVEPLTDAGAYRRETGTLPPKGVLLCGIPGCGKSEAAKFTARTLKMPLLRMDIGSLMDKYVGGSEQRMRQALRLAAAMSPCVLWIDELEKGFSGAGSGSGDDGAFKRMFAYLLGWMQEHEEPCFIFATANNIGGLPKEFFRSGRFDELYAVYLPTMEECVSIFQACMGMAEDVAGKEREKAGDERKVKLFGEGCKDTLLLKRVIDGLVQPRTMKKAGEKLSRPRMVTGADIRKIVDVSLRRLRGKADGNGIPKEIWVSTLKEVISECSVYGDSEENIDSMAISYCRMLRKGFKPTADRVLFKNEDYHIENLEELEKLKKMSVDGMGKEKLEKHFDRMRDLEILQKNDEVFSSEYDQAVYSYLRERINKIALPLEQYERDQMITR